MRTLGRVLQALLGLMLAALAGSWLLETASRWAGRPTAPLQEGWRSGLGLQLAAGQWIDFGVPSTATELRVVSNLVLSATTEDAGAVDYQIDYLLADGKDLPLQQGSIALSASGAADVQPISIPGEPLQAAFAREFVIAADPGRARSLRLRWSGSGEALLMRVHVRERLDADQLTARWRRMTDGERRALADHHLMPLEWLDGGERRGLAARAWRPLPPVDAGALQTLYIRDQLSEPEDSIALPAPAADQLSALHRLAYRLPPTGGILRIAPFEPGSEPVQLEWSLTRHDGVSETTQSMIVKAVTELPLPTGYDAVRLGADGPLDVQWQPQPAEPLRIGGRLCYAAASESLRYRLPATAAGRALRIDSVFATNQGALHLLGLDKEGKPVWRSEIRALADPSPWHQDTEQPQQPWYPGPRRYLQLPAAVAELTLQGKGWIRLRTRAESVPWELGADPGPRWFRIRPQASARNPSVCLWQMPEGADPRRWQAGTQLAPRGPTVQRTVLIEAPLDDDNTRCAAPLEADYRVAADDGGLPPRLVLFAREPLAGMMSVETGSLRYATPLSGYSAAWRLPAWPAAGSTLLLSGAGSEDAEVWVEPAHRGCPARLREAWPLPSTGLQFALPALKPDQRIMLQWLPPTEHPPPLRIALSTTSIPLSDSYDPPLRRWELTSGAAASRIVGGGESLQAPLAQTIRHGGETGSDAAMLRITADGSAAGLVRVWIETEARP